MKIGIDARMWNESGIGRYLRNLIFELVEIDRRNDYYVLLRKPEYQDLKFNSKRVQKILADFSWYGLTEQWNLPGILAKHRLDLVHFPHFNVPLLYGGRFVVTIHDLIHQHYGAHHSAIKKFGYQKIFKFATLKSQKILTPTQFVKDQLTNEWNLNTDKIVVTPEGVDRSITKLIPQTDLKVFQKITNQWGVGDQYLFYIGNAHPHKNIERLITVFQQIRILHPKLQLVLAGKENQFWRRVLNTAKLDRVLYLGLITDVQMVAIYKHALALIMPSLEEGFGIPILEAMECSCPVVASEIGSLKEVGGEAIFTFDPRDEGEMRTKILQVVENARLRAILRQKGLKRVKQFSWTRLARQTLQVYESCLSS